MAVGFSTLCELRPSFLFFFVQQPLQKLIIEILDFIPKYNIRTGIKCIIYKYTYKL